MTAFWGSQMPGEGRGRFAAYLTNLGKPSLQNDHSVVVAHVAHYFFRGFSALSKIRMAWLAMDSHK